MDMRVDVARQNEFAFAVDDRSPSFGPHEALRFTNFRDTISVDQNYRVVDDLIAIRIDERSAGERDFLRAHGAREDQQDKGESN